jgi:ribonuclease Z
MRSTTPQSFTWRGQHVHVYVPFTRAGVAQQIWIENKQGAILVDAGDGTLRDILAHDLSLDKLRGIFFTHGHFDHMGGLHTLLGFLRMIGRKEELPLYSPEGCTEVNAMVIGFISCYADTIPYQIQARTCPPREPFEFAGMTIEVYPMVHYGGIAGAGLLAQVPAAGYRISCRGETVAISGDSAECPALCELVRGADLALIEATFADATKVSKETLAKTHLTEAQAVALGETAKEYRLVHKGSR